MPGRHVAERHGDGAERAHAPRLEPGDRVGLLGQQRGAGRLEAEDLERARLEQQSPYAELRRLAGALDLPELADVADVMQLDETGAALSGALRARVRELRDAHLTAEQIRASADAEGMTIYMTLPAMAFGLILLMAALEVGLFRLFKRRGWL